jgi:hypothetical protein
MKKYISLEAVKNYNVMVEAAIETKAYDMLALYREYRDDSKKWGGNPYKYLYPISTYEWVKDKDSVKFYLKTVSGVEYLYMDLDGEPADRYLLNDIAKAFFNA